MIYTNKYGLPDAFYRAVMGDPYSKGESDFSATGLLNPPRATVLLERHGNEIEVDVSSRVAATIGQGVHSILERAQREHDLIETRFFGTFEVMSKSYIVSAQIDLYEPDTETLYDWKTTKAYAFHKKTGTKKEWEIQLNIGAYLLEMSKYGERHDVEHLKIIGLLKDWDYKKAETEKGYPPTEVMTMELKRWAPSETEEYIMGRILLVEKARIELPRCTSVETWGGNRCARWCDASSVCEQYKQARKTGLIGEQA